MKITTKQMTQFALLTALALILGFIDEQIPLLNGIIPGFKLGLANTVLLYAVYIMNWFGAVLLMLTKVLLSSLLFGGMNYFWFRLCGGVLSVAVMLLLKKKPEIGILIVGILAAAADILLVIFRPALIWEMILCGLTAVACVVLFILMKRNKISRVMGTSLAGAVAHNLGQTVAAAVTYHTLKIYVTYFPLLVVVGAIVGCLTGLVAERVMKLLKSGAIS